MEDIEKTEVWTNAEANPGFLISNMGRVRGLRAGAILKPSKTSNGYPMLKWRVGYKWHTEMLHRAIAKAFVPNPLGLPQVNHKNGNKADARAENLEWVTQEQNMRHAVDTGLAPVGEKSNNAKLKASEAVEIVRLCKSGLSHKKAAELFGVTQASATRVVLGHCWSHATGIKRQ